MVHAITRILRTSISVCCMYLSYCKLDELINAYLYTKYQYISCAIYMYREFAAGSTLYYVHYTLNGTNRKVLRTL